MAANEIMNVFNKGDPSSVKGARKIAGGVFGEDWEKKGAAIYDEGPKEVNVWGIGMHFQIIDGSKMLILFTGQ